MDGGELVKRAQNAAENGTSEELYDIIKQLAGQNNRQAVAAKNKDGKLLKNKEARLARWKRYSLWIIIKKCGIP